MLFRTGVWANPCFFMADLQSDDPVIARRPTNDSVRSCLAVERRRGEAAIFVIGDSHAAALIPGMRLLASSQGSILQWAATGSGCGFNPWALTWAQEPSCALYVNMVKEVLLEELRDGDRVLVMTAAYKFAANTKIAANVDFLRSFRNDVITRKGASLLLLGDVPTLPIWGLSCRQQLSWSRCYTQMDAPENANHHANTAALIRLAQETPRQVAVCDLSPFFCNSNGRCGAQVPGTNLLAYLDTGHLSTTGARYLWPHLCSCLTAFVRRGADSNA
jgi:hypothetical protein